MTSLFYDHNMYFMTTFIHNQYGTTRDIRQISYICKYSHRHHLSFTVYVRCAKGNTRRRIGGTARRMIAMIRTRPTIAAMAMTATEAGRVRPLMRVSSESLQASRDNSKATTTWFCSWSTEVFTTAAQESSRTALMTSKVPLRHDMLPRSKEQ